MIQETSPHCSSRDGHEITCVVIHYTAGLSLKSSVDWGKDPNSKCSWHFIIGRDGQVVQQVPIEQAAWHAGASQAIYKGRMTLNVNRFSIGIELCNLGQLVRKDGTLYHQADPAQLTPYSGLVTPGDMDAKLLVRPETLGTAPLVFLGPWEPFPEPQLLALEVLLMHLRSLGYVAACGNLLGHNEVCTPRGRKVDPGPVFPWGRYRQNHPGIAVPG